MRALQSVAASESGYQRNAGARFAFLGLFIFLTLPAQLYALDLADVARLSRSGAPQLALSVLSQYQPDYKATPKEWLRWERMRLRIMQQQGQWSELSARIGSYPSDLPAEFMQWSEERHASALINGGRYSAARQLLRGAIWGGGRDTVSGERLVILRRLVMESYLEEGRIDDAYAAMLRYHQDYAGERDADALLLRAKVLLAAGRAADSLSLLQRLAADGTTEALMALASLRSGGSSGRILEQARRAARADLEGSLRWLWLGVMAEAAGLQRDAASQIIALEQMLPLQRQLQGSEQRLFNYTPQQLWQGYLTYAEGVGNREQLLRGDDQAWLAAAEQTANLYPVRKRSLYAQVAINGMDSLMREQAHQQLMTLYDAMGQDGVVLLQRLYLEGDYFRNRASLPAVVAYRLVDEALHDADLDTASQLLQLLPQPPGGTALFAWQMRRSKIFVLAGDYAEADKLLSALMPHAAALNEEQRDQLIQLLFDLQGVDEHERAFRLLAELYKRVEGIELRRELLFWMADSRKAQQRHAEAAWLYLQSATISDNDSMDPWAQTARYQAAKSLTAAGMERDAEFVYQQLLKVTENPKRRSVLRHELQQLRLRGKAG